MPKYIAHSKTWLSHENRLVEAGQEFETTFPEGMKLSGNIELVEDKTAPSRTRRPRVVKTGGDPSDGEQSGADTHNDDDQGDGSDADTGDLDDASGD